MAALITSTGAQAGQARYSAYGVPFGIPEGDLNADGVVNGADSTIINGILSIGGYRVAADLDFDGDVDFDDSDLLANNSGASLGRGMLSLDPKTGVSPGAGNRRGYAGYEHDGAVHVLAHVRNCVLHAELGRPIPHSRKVSATLESHSSRPVSPAKYGLRPQLALKEALRRLDSDRSQQCLTHHESPQLVGPPCGPGYIDTEAVVESPGGETFTFSVCIMCEGECALYAMRALERQVSEPRAGVPGVPCTLGSDTVNFPTGWNVVLPRCRCAWEPDWLIII